MREKVVALLENLIERSENNTQRQTKFLKVQKKLTIEAQATPDHFHNSPFEAGRNFGYGEALNDIICKVEQLLSDNRLEPMNAIVTPSAK